jgi:hypothetical protein
VFGSGIESRIRACGHAFVMVQKELEPLMGRAALPGRLTPINDTEDAESLGSK